ncbi:negative regulator of beta-lactamase expression [Bernardetia litoralis DSM 6794]|uniref:N-acetylmuramoyl-L-alanine amidase n=1 Tax=Bernardetia litoralis (strain ATCC 23117 / DSM 6794 / NBRC 15988 / NCIMB 1366 / Fx l1 / Sio-4) TaxID=880071 RepID=I4AQX6_BERLS|nr:N-acetylmuramoyl-L-alanine amidase [Bernardetia litoralis]AFM06361.1 negative regulator of beta-lactamase expression [Bernardetia litoralis DSM 6794]
MKKTYLTITCLLFVLFFISSAFVPSKSPSLAGGEEKFIPKTEVAPKLLSNACSRNRSSDASITHVMLHFCSNAAKKPENPYNLKDILNIFETYRVSAHYIIDREGIIHHLVNENRAAHHAGRGHLAHEGENHHNDLNGRSIGIEMMAIGTQTEMSKFISTEKYQKINKNDVGFTEAQYKSLARLLKDIESRHADVSHDRKHIVGHDEYAPSRRSDPGSLFDWNKIGLTLN